MSRLREALLRAERERAESNGGESLLPLAMLSDDDPVPDLGVMETAVLPDPTATMSGGLRSNVAHPAPVLPAADVMLKANRMPIAPPQISEALVDLQTARKVEWRPSPSALINFDSAIGPGTEELRTLRTRLKGIRSQSDLRRLLISSTLPGEGKTFLATNLAQALASQYGTRVLLVDGDLRRPAVHTALGAPLTPGLAEYLSGKVKEEWEIVQAGSINNLHFIPAGRHPAASERLTAERVGTLLDHLSDSFDWIIVDSPPALGLSDASILSRACDGVLLVAVAGQTPYVLAQKARKEFSLCPVLGMVLNRVAPSETYGRYYYNYKTSETEGR